jgi:putative nucleotidyltransferase with HDIG domain
VSSRFDARDDGRLILLQPWRPTQNFLERVKSALSLVLLVAFTLTLAGGLLISHRMTQPLRDMVTVAERVAAGEWDCRAAEGGSAEVAVLATAFNHMTANLRHWYRAAQSHAAHLAETLQQLRQAHGATLKALSRALDARDNETEGHSLRVTHYALRLADVLVISPQERAALKWGALLHDIGKIGIPDAILNKPGKLTDAEFDVMRGHCLLGLEIVRGIPYLERAADVIRCHHERYDGTGYPDGLAGAVIPRVARIFAVADTLDAITSDRPYRRASPFSHALSEVEAGSGTQFDPEVVAALRLLVTELQEWRRRLGYGYDAPTLTPEEFGPAPVERLEPHRRPSESVALLGGG